MMRARSRTRLGVTVLESREVPSTTPTVAEQVFLERLNDARANPAAYGAAVGVDLGYIAASPPLAFDTRLIAAARNHSAEMNALGYFSHTGAGGSSPGQRMTAAGYPTLGWAESIAAGYATPEQALAELIVDTGVPSLGHRHHLLAHGGAAGHRDVGVGVVQNGGGPYNHYYTIDSGATGDTRPALTGVAYTDANGNNRYDAGEGLGGVTVTVAGVGSTTTWSTGGYTFKLNPGTYTVTAAGGGLGGTVVQQVTVGGANLRLNFRPDFAGPRVSEAAFADPGSGTLTSARVTFSEPVNPATFTPADVTLTGPGGAIAAAAVNPVAGTGNTQFDVTFPTQPAGGTYTLAVGPDVRDASNNAMDQNGNGVNGEAADRFSTSAALPATVVLVDDGDAGYAAAGWDRASGAGYAAYHGADTGFRLGSASAGPATWTTTLAAGTYRVSATWVPNANRATDARYSVRNGSGAVLASRTLSQELAPDDRSGGGTAWEDLGTATLSSAGALTVELSGAGNEYLIADAVRFELVGPPGSPPPPPPPPPPSAVTVVDDGDAGYSAAGWDRAAGAGFEQYHGSDTGYRFGSAGAPAAAWTASLAAGTYRVSATWTGHPNRASNAQYSVANGSGAVLAARAVNQQLNPDDLAAGGSLWEDLGTVTLTAAGTLTARLDGAGNGYLIADAVRFELVGSPPPPPPPGAVTVVDDGDAGYAAAGWERAAGTGFGEYLGSDTGYRLGSAAGGPATWTATSLAAGTYRVSATWVGHPNRATNAQYAVVGGAGVTLASRTVNQQLDPNDFTAGGTAWEDLGTVSVSANGSLTVRLAGVGDGYLIADAVRFERVA